MDDFIGGLNRAAIPGPVGAWKDGLLVLPSDKSVSVTLLCCYPWGLQGKWVEISLAVSTPIFTQPHSLLR